ncbi:class F sortase [Micromonospora sp. WMMD1128]|uniref:class F sortase n=1 Tax=unclassified Micromonospora TaxID=2617518 RepID=UPI00248B2816|nr:MULTISPECIES: class F sortase [unclassified Micromonospora]WBB76429.1 class F sortase [Micromonospora sp. WMMD1128]WFE35788.1 class F sortase [Micromonospora sp. WMMD975]
MSSSHRRRGGPSRARTAAVVTAVTLAGAAGAGLVSAGLGSTSASPPQPGSSAAPATERPGADGPTLPRSTPARVVIPRIGVDAEIVPVATDDGALEVPPLERPEVAGWYRPGPAPGQAGNAVLVGHVDTQRGPAVFFDLGRLRPGDTVRVVRADGRTAAFTVDGVGTYPKDRFPTERVYGGGAAARLRLITCGGRFNPRTGSYPDNIVVFATATR